MTRHLLGAAAVLLCVACGSPDNADERDDRGSARNEAGANSSADRDEADSDRPRTGRDALVGRWSRDEDCGRILEFRDDGSLVSATGVPGRWQTEPGEAPHDLILVMEDDTQRARVGVDLRGDEMQMTNIETDQATLVVHRCEGR